MNLPVPIAIPANLLEQIGISNEEIIFTPHLLPIPRGILSTIYVRFKKAQSRESVAEVYRKFFSGSPMVRLYEKTLPQIQYSVRTNYADIGFQLDAGGKRAIIVSCLDNLLKGAAGQAVQNLNVIEGWPESFPRLRRCAGTRLASRRRSLERLQHIVDCVSRHNQFGGIAQYRNPHERRRVVFDAILAESLERLVAAESSGRAFNFHAKFALWKPEIEAPFPLRMEDVLAIRTKVEVRRQMRLRIANFPEVFVVGDYMFDATLNGVLDSAEAATDFILSQILHRRRNLLLNPENASRINVLSSGQSADIVRGLFFETDFLVDILGIVWGLKAGARILIAGSRSGKLVGALREAWFDAWGIESDRLAHRNTPDELQKYNMFGYLGKLPFPDGYFEVVIETGLCRLPEEAVPGAIAELRRVTQRGLVLGSVTTDLPIDLIERYDLLIDISTLRSRWDWSEQLFAVGFDHVLIDTPRLIDAWNRVKAVGGGPGHWYEDAESVLFCFYGRRYRYR